MFERREYTKSEVDADASTNDEQVVRETIRLKAYAADRKTTLSPEYAYNSVENESD